MSPFWRTVTIVAAVGSAAGGGVFFAFSAFVMPALRRLPANQGIAAMQSINVTAVRMPLMALLMGTAALSAVLAVRACLHLDDRRQLLVLGGTAVYLVGCIVVTGAFHVPRNDSLARLDAADPASAGAWASYVREWTWGNHVRAAAGLAAGVLYVAALLPARDGAAQESATERSRSSASATSLSG